MQKTYWIYMLASSRNGALYVGVTSDLARRVYEHKNGLIKGHTKTYGIKNLVWCESCNSAQEAIAYEKRVKKWRRVLKVEVIERHNKKWEDLYDYLN